MILKFIKSPIALAWLALFVSFSQLIASIPLLTGFYSAPKLKLDGSTTTINDKMSVGTFQLVNSGLMPATNVEIGFATRIGDRVIIMPDVAHSITTDKDPVVIDHARLEFPRILPGEVVIITVMGKGDGAGKVNETLKLVFSGMPFKLFPFVSYLRSDQGSGVIKQQGVKDDLEADSPIKNGKSDARPPAQASGSK